MVNKNVLRFRAGVFKAFAFLVVSPFGIFLTNIYLNFDNIVWDIKIVVRLFIGIALLFIAIMCLNMSYEYCVKLDRDYKQGGG